MGAIWDVPGKNNNDENNTDASFLANLFRASFYQKWDERNDYNWEKV